MSLSNEMRLLQTRWLAGNMWPQRLEWLEIEGIRGWTGKRIEFNFPIVAVSGENGSGKSTVLQSAASVYAAVHGRGRFASDFFPNTAWEQVTNANIRASIRQGQVSTTTSVRKPTTRWLGNRDRKTRAVSYIDLTRIQPVASRIGYQRLATSSSVEATVDQFQQATVDRLSNIMGRQYIAARMSTTNLDATRQVPVVSIGASTVSGFHQGAGELTITEFLRVDPPDYSLLLIDEIETSLHPRAQRRLMRDLATLCRVKQLQIILTTHSPYILGELPPQARGYIMQSAGEKEFVAGVSPEFAMTMMDEQQHPEVDLYVEDQRAEEMLRELIVRFSPEAVNRVKIIRYGAANVGQSLGTMVQGNRFPRPSRVFLDGDQAPQNGCILLPGGDAPERVIVPALHAINWGELHARLARGFADVADACNQSMTIADHHEWVRAAANRLLIAGDFLWTAMCAEWAQRVANDAIALPITQEIGLALAMADAA